MPTALPSLSIASPDCAEAFFAGRVHRQVRLHRAGSLTELRAVLERRLDDPVTPATLDLIGHSTREHHLLRLGTTPIDMLQPQVAHFFRTLAETRLLVRLDIARGTEGTHVNLSFSAPLSLSKSPVAPYVP